MLRDIFSNVFFVCGTIVTVIFTVVLSGIGISMIGFGIVDLLEDYSEEKRRRNL